MGRRRVQSGLPPFARPPSINLAGNFYRSQLGGLLSQQIRLGNSQHGSLVQNVDVAAERMRVGSEECNHHLVHRDAVAQIPLCDLRERLASLHRAIAASGWILDRASELLAAGASTVFTSMRELRDLLRSR